MITLNSTAGLQAIHHKKPTLALGRAIYNISGLVHEGGFESFMESPVAPDMALYKKFRNYVMLETQINGNFYNKQYFKLTAQGIIKRMNS